MSQFSLMNLGIELGAGRTRQRSTRGGPCGRTAARKPTAGSLSLVMDSYRASHVICRRHANGVLRGGTPEPIGGSRARENVGTGSFGFGLSVGVTEPPRRRQQGGELALIRQL